MDDLYRIVLGVGFDIGAMRVDMALFFGGRSRCSTNQGVNESINIEFGDDTMAADTAL